MSERPEQTCHKRKQRNGQYTHEKMLRVTSHWGNAREKHRSHWLNCKKQTISSVDKHVEQLHLMHCWCECKMVRHFENWPCLIRANIPVHPPGTSNSIPRFLSRRHKNISLKQDLDEKIHNNQKLETTWILVNKWVNKQIVDIHTKDHYTATKGMNYWHTQQEEYDLTKWVWTKETWPKTAHLP